MKKLTCQCKSCHDGGCKCAPYARFFTTLGNNNRLHIVNTLRKGPASVSEIVAATGLEQTCVSHCLSELNQYGFVTSKRHGKFKIFTVRGKTVDQIMGLIDTHVAKYCTTVPS